MNFGGIDEINEVIIYNASYPEIIQLCQTNKFFNNICQSEDFWKMLNQRDFKGLAVYNTKVEYIALYQLFNKNTLEIIKIGLNPNQLYISISNIYTSIFNILVNLVRKNKDVDAYDIDDRKEYAQIIANFGIIDDPFKKLREIVNRIYYAYRRI